MGTDQYSCGVTPPHPCQPEAQDVVLSTNLSVEELLREPRAELHRALSQYAKQAANILRKQEEDAKRAEIERLRTENSQLQAQLSHAEAGLAAARPASREAWAMDGRREFQVAPRSSSSSNMQEKIGSNASLVSAPAICSAPSSQFDSNALGSNQLMVVPSTPAPLPSRDDMDKELTYGRRSLATVRSSKANAYTAKEETGESRFMQAARRLTRRFAGRFSLSDGDGARPYYPIFPDPEEIKDKVRSAIKVQSSITADSFHVTGWAQRVARSVLFEWFTLFVIAFNAIWIAIDVDLNQAKNLGETKAQFLLMDQFFCTYFTFEILVRFFALRQKADVLKDSWFMFDSVLVVLTIIDTWVLLLVIVASGGQQSAHPGGATVLRLFRLLRLTRMARMLRLVRAVPELMVLLKGMKAAARSVALTLVLLSGIIYVFAILLRQTTDGTELGRLYFDSVPAAMGSLLLRGTLPDQADFVIDSGSESYAYGSILLVFIFLASLTVMNMLIGVLVQVVSAISHAEQEEMSTVAVKSLVENLIKKYGIDTNCNKCISLKEFELLLSVPEAVRLMANLGVDVVGLVDYADFIFEGGTKELSFGEFFVLLQQLRGRNAATVRDIVDLRKFIFQVVTAHDAKSPGKVANPLLESVRKTLRHDTLDVLQVASRSQSFRNFSDASA